LDKTKIAALELAYYEAYQTATGLSGLTEVESGIRLFLVKWQETVLKIKMIKARLTRLERLMLEVTFAEENEFAGVMRPLQRRSGKRALVEGSSRLSRGKHPALSPDIV